jgi:glycosyltransferase involved in cell wall biosynthesis
MPKFVLILMVRNEERILERCMKSVEGFVEAYCICDTGSTDKTREIAAEFLKTHDGCLTQVPWQDFGYNRTASFANAQTYLRRTGWDLKDTYGLLLDADMMFVPGVLKSQTLEHVGYTIVQCAGSMEYPNTRLVRMDYLWVCKGVTHEYWDAPCDHIPKAICYIADFNDGGCKSDKFQRDALLLEKGLIDEPTNVRYMFYLAQTYHSTQRWKDSIAMYKRRIRAGGWFEEIWYSHYMIAKCHRELRNIPKFEEWMLRAHAYRNERAESLYELTKHFRECGQHYKAYQYVIMGQKIPMSTDSLFIETDVYRGLFDYEQSILDYYVKSNRYEGLQSSVKYMLKLGLHHPSILYNLQYYTKPLVSERRRLMFQSPFDRSLSPSALSVLEYPIVNVRYVNYKVDNGNFITEGGVSLCENACFNLETGKLVAKMDESTVGLPTVEGTIRGLEDVRGFKDTAGNYCFTATVHNYAEGAIRILRGQYLVTGSYSKCVVLPSPRQRHCEKNWLPITGTDLMIYDWHPLTLVDSAGTIISEIPTPPMFSNFRGSAPPIRINNMWWTLVHMVDYGPPRKYYHCLVELNDDFTPIRVSMPFTFVSPAIEYCLSFRLVDETLHFFAGINETALSRFIVRLTEFTWNML